MTPASKVTQKLLLVLRSLPLKDTYMLMPVAGFSDVQLLEYWVPLDAAGLLRYRFNDSSSPCAEEALMYQRQSQHIYSKTDCFVVVETLSSKIVAEVAVSDMTGKAGQFHFSVLDSNSTSLNNYLGTAISDFVLNSMTSRGGPYVNTLFGLTPVLNRAACFLVLRSGFKKMGILPSGCLFATEICDAMVTTKLRKI